MPVTKIIVAFRVESIPVTKMNVALRVRIKIHDEISRPKERRDVSDETDREGLEYETEKRERDRDRDRDRQTETDKEDRQTVLYIACFTGQDIRVIRAAQSSHDEET